MGHLILIAAVAVYLGRVLAPLLGRSTRDPRLGWAGLALHGIGLLVVIALEGPTSTPHLVLVGIALLLMLASQMVSRMPRMDALESVLLPLTIAVLVLGLLAPGQSGGVTPASWWLPIHLSFMVLGFGGLAVSFALSVLYLWVRARLKGKRLVGIGRLPSLAALDDLNQKSMALGFIALTSGIVCGALWALGVDGSTARLDLTTLSTLVVWLWYAIGLQLRLISGYRGRIAALFGVLGFGGISLIMAVAALVFRSFHGVSS
ncbi:MAG: cytochrome c biogenesis protein CcsA [Myxococcota bacterium]|nr:cytochrome c biogenesis protein CcsA [Myxococcota bacterium]